MSHCNIFAIISILQKMFLKIVKFRYKADGSLELNATYPTQKGLY